MSDDYKNTIEILCAIAGGLFVLAFWIWRRESAAQKWPKVSGVVVTSRLSSNRPPEELMVHSGSPVSPIIEYEFSYQGQSFRSSRRRLGNFSIGSGMAAIAVTSRYPIGSPVTVFVNPRDPTKSALEVNGSLFWVPFAFGVFFLGLAIVIALALRR